MTTHKMTNDNSTLDLTSQLIEPAAPENPPVALISHYQYHWDISRVTHQIEWFTKEQALALAKGHVRNRGLSDKHLDKLLGIFLRGNWIFNGQTIVFDWDDNLMEGQHRLWMIAQGDQIDPVPVLVVRGVDPAAFPTFDLGKRRTLKDILIIEASSAPDVPMVILAAMLGYLTAYHKTKQFISARAVEDERIDFFDEHREVKEFAKCYKRSNRLKIPAGLFAACHYLFAQKSVDQANEFMAQVLEGEIVTKEDPAWRYREWVETKAGKKRGVKIVDTAGQTLVKAWNLYRTGERMTSPLKPPLVSPEVE